MLLENEEFRAQISGPAAELAVPQIVQVFRSREGLSALLEFFEGAEPIEGTRVVRVGTPTEFKDALDDAGTRPVVCMFAGAKDLGARVLLPVYHRLPAADEFDSLEFLRVEVATDDGLAQAVCEEAFVAKTCPTPSDSNSSEQRCTALPLLITTPLLLLPLQVPDADLLLLLAVLGAQAVEVRGLRRGGADAKAEEARRGGRERRGSGAVGAGRIVLA